LLGDRIDRGRVRRRRTRDAGQPGGLWRSLAHTVVTRPRIALVAVVVTLAPLVLSVLQLHTSDAGLGDLPPRSPVLAAQRAIERAWRS
jgi:RND superfamily putative drug exporter